MHVSLGIWNNQPQSDYYAINFAAEFNRGDFDGFELDSTGILDNPWNWRSQNFVFETFYNEKLYGDHPNIYPNPDDVRNCAFSMNPLRYRYSTAHKIYGGIIDDFCVDPDQVPCYYAPVNYILPSRLAKYEELYDTEVEGGRGRLKQPSGLRLRHQLRHPLEPGADHPAVRPHPGAKQALVNDGCSAERRDGCMCRM